MRKFTNCLVCQSPDAKYRFKCCRKLFCSTNCFGEHTGCEIVQIPKPFVPERRFIRSDNFDLNLADEEIISDEVLEKLAGDSAVIDVLRDPLLHRILIRLDNARDRRKAFSTLCESSPLFLELVERVSTAVGYARDAEI